MSDINKVVETTNHANQFILKPSTNTSNTQQNSAVVKPVTIRSRSNSRSEDPLEHTDENLQLVKRLKQQLENIKLEVINTPESIKIFPNPGTFNETLKLHKLNFYLNTLKFQNRSEWLHHIMADTTSLIDIGYGGIFAKCTFLIEPTQQLSDSQDF